MDKPAPLSPHQLPCQTEFQFDSAPPFDLAQRERLLAEHLPEVHFIARRIHSRLPGHIPLEDLVHAGVIGLIDAVDKFDPAKRVQLKSYAKFRIRGAILDSLRDADWSPRSLRHQSRRLEEAQRVISGSAGRAATETELAEYLGLELPAFQELLAELRGLEVASLHDSAAPDDEEPQPSAAAPAPQADPFSLCLQSEIKSHLAQAISALDRRQREVLSLYYCSELTMKEVGEMLGIGESRVSQIHSAALAQLRGRMQSALRTSAAA